MLISRLQVDNQTLSANIGRAIDDVHRGVVDCVEVATAAEPASGTGQYLFFIKPELTLLHNQGRLPQVLDPILQTILAFPFEIETISVISGRYLRDHQIMQKHYGVINRLARSARANFSADAQQSFCDLFHVPIDGAHILGGFEFLQEYPALSPQALETLWLSVPNKKISSGAYCALVSVKGKDIYLINGFHPQQIAHFTSSDRSIITMQLRSSNSWRMARRDFVGATDPLKASPRSLRNFLYNNRETLGLGEISQRFNGVHMSAGPLEALAELCRFDTMTATTDARFNVDRFQFGRALLEFLNIQQLEFLLQNPSVKYNAKSSSVFDLTEEADPEEATKILRQVKEQFAPFFAA